MRGFPYYRLWLAVLTELTFSLVGSHAQADSETLNSVPYKPARGAAMGGAYLPLGRDAASGLFYNPAVLSQIRKTEFEPINMIGYFNQNYPSIGGLSGPSLERMAGGLQSNPGKWSAFGAQFVPTLGMTNISFGLLASTDVGGIAAQDGTITYRSKYQIIPAIGFGYAFLKGYMRLGYSLQWINQASGTATTTDTSGVGFNQGLAQGSAFSHNLGLALSFPALNRPSFNVVLRNALGAHFATLMPIPIAASSIGVPDTIPMMVDVSFDLQNRLGKGAYLNLVISERDVTNQSAMPLMTHFSVGMEMVIKERVFFRGGWGSGYPSFGIGFKKPGSSELNLAWYSEELGNDFLSQRDTRYVLQYQVKY